MVEKQARLNWREGSAGFAVGRLCLSFPSLHARTQIVSGKSNSDWKYDFSTQQIKFNCSPDEISAFHNFENLRIQDY